MYIVKFKYAGQKVAVRISKEVALEIKELGELDQICDSENGDVWYLILSIKKGQPYVLEAARL